MRIRAAVISTLCLAASTVPAAEIPKGTHVLLRMVNSISTRTAQEGDTVYLHTASPIVLDNKIVVPVGSYVQGVVSQAKRSARVKGRAEIGIRLDTLTLPSGKSFKISPKLDQVDSAGSDQKVKGGENQIKQGGDKARDAGQVAITAGTGAAIGAVVDRSVQGAGIGGGAGAVVGLASVLLTRGREVELRQGATLDFVFDRPVTID